jgi:hypothetical protein
VKLTKANSFNKELKKNIVPGEVVAGLSGEVIARSFSDGITLVTNKELGFFDSILKIFIQSTEIVDRSDSGETRGRSSR